MTLKINRVPDSQVCTKFGQNLLTDVDSRVFTRMLRKDGSVTISPRIFVGEGIKTAIRIGVQNELKYKFTDSSSYFSNTKDRDNPISRFSHI